MKNISRTICLVYLCIAEEWLFFSTKDSIFTWQSFSACAASLWTAALFFAVVAAALQCLLMLAGRAIRFMSPKITALSADGLTLAGIGGILLLLIVDNFTYTVFHYGIVNTGGRIRLLYGLLWAIIVFRLARRYRALPASRHWKFTALALLLLSVSVCSWKAVAGAASGFSPEFPETIQRRPNIILFASDGINADNTSAYGYSRKTTPVLDALLDRGLIADFAISNSGVTLSSTAAMLNGLLPTTTKVFRAPNVFLGRSAYLHLPGILKRFGYRTLQQSIPYYGDAEEANMREAFDESNGNVHIRGLFSRLPLPLQNAFALDRVFVSQLEEKVVLRLFHILFLRQMLDISQLAGSPHYARQHGFSDRRQLARARRFIDADPAPFFIHIHLMSSHCCGFAPALRHFSAGLGPYTGKMWRDYYDDSVMSADFWFGKLLSFLRKRRLLKNTVIVYSSDHGLAWNVHERVPLIFLFPDAEYRGRIETPVQLADVTPTLLEYLGIPRPPGLDGQSLLHPEALNPARQIFTAARMSNSSNHSLFEPLFAALPGARDVEEMTLTVCNRQFNLILDSGEIQQFELKGFSGNCPAGAVPDAEQAKSLILRHLREHGLTQ
jgi:hypothetical protein